jgi:hypothetical protein
LKVKFFAVSLIIALGLSSIAKSIGSALLSPSRTAETTRFIGQADKQLVLKSEWKSGVVLAEIGDFYVINKAQVSSPSQGMATNASSLVKEESPLLVFDSVTNRYGLTDRSFFIFPYEMSTLDQLVADYGLKIKKSFLNANMALVVGSIDSDLIKDLDEIQSDYRIRGVELNVNFQSLELQ